MDPLSITASIVGVTTAAIQSVHFLANTLENVKDAPSLLRGVVTDLQAIQLVMESLDKSFQDDNSQIMQNDNIKRTVENCDRACGAFQSKVKNWMKHSEEDKMFWVDRWKVGLFGLELVKTFRAQLSDCKSTLSVALNTATIFKVSRQENTMKEMKDLMLQQNEAVVRLKTVQANTEAAEAQSAMHELMMNKGGYWDSMPQQSKEELLRELGKQQEANRVFKNMCEEVLSATTQERTGQKIRGVKVTNNGSAFTGFINTSSDKWKINQDISDIHVDGGSIAVTGVMENIDFKNLHAKGV